MPYRHFSDVTRGLDDGAVNAALSRPVAGLLDEANAASTLARASVSSGRLDNALEAYIKGETFSCCWPWSWSQGELSPLTWCCSPHPRRQGHPVA